MSTPLILNLVATKRQALAAKKREVELLEAEIRGMEAILALVPQTGTSSEVGDGGSVGPASQNRMHGKPNAGRQPGAISNRWKRNLIALSEQYDVFGVDEVIAQVFDAEGRMMRPSEVKRLFEKYDDQGHINTIDKDHYAVPDSALRRFRASLREEGGAHGDDDSEKSSDQDGVDNSTAEEASDAEYWAKHAASATQRNYDLEDDPLI